MSTPVLERPAPAAPRGVNGGLPARRAVIRWAWRMFRREWRQQLLILSLIVVAVAATTVGVAVATNTPLPVGTGFGTAQDMATFQAPDPHLASQIAALEQRFGQVDVIENQTIAVPGSIDTYNLRAQDPQGAFGQPMLSLVSGHYPAGPGEVAVTSGVAADFRLRVGELWQGRRITGIVENPQNLLDEFALVAPGQVRAPSEVTVLFDAPGVAASHIGPNVVSVHAAGNSNPVNPESITIAGVTLGMLLIALVAVGGFTVVAQRRLRSIGMLASLGATDRNVRLVVRANGVVVGIVGAVIGAALGLALWLAYRPLLETNTHHAIGVLSVPWLVVVLAMVLAVVATYIAASRGLRHHPDPGGDGPVRPPRTPEGGAPLGRAGRDRLPGPRLPAAGRFGRARGPRRRSGLPGLRVCRAGGGGGPAGPVLPGHLVPHRPARPGLGAAGAAGSGPLPGPVWLGAGSDQCWRAHRRGHLRGRHRPLLERA